DGKKVTTFSLEYDRAQRHAKWVAFSFDRTTAKTGSGRTDQWGNDPAIPSNDRSSRSDFYGYDRGHICASYDRQYSEEANIQTFYYSNMSPQIGNFNQHIWVNLEQKVQNWGRSSVFRNELYVVKGGTIKADQVLGYNGPHNIPVPRYYWMTLVCEKNGYYKGIAFWLEHKSYGDGPFDFETFAISIDELEKRTGFDFFPNLPDDIEDKIEAAYDYSKWP
ncbi:MAG: DNA/RNA non-specific endonuclease, partial [Bacteroidaceae bacterium]|nr:DNA/RNA non-specific endonuclease [Bacteroidaceae bacterium]